MKILFSPCHYVYDEISGGEISWAFNIADRISKIYPSSVVVTGYKNLLNEKKYRIIEIQPNKKNIDLSIKNAAIFSIKYFSATKKLLSKNKFNIIHHVLPFGINSTFNFNFIFNKKRNLVIGPIQSSLTYKDLDINLSDIRSNTEQNSFSRIFFGFIYFLIHPILKVLSNLTLKKAKAVVVINKYTKKILIKNGINSDKIYIIPPGIDIKRFEYIPFESKNKEKIELLVVCYLIRRKGVDLIIRSIKKIIKKNKKIILRIIGDGPQKENLKNLVEELNLEDYVIFEGFVENREIQEYYKKAHIFISMSRAESWGQMYLEAMASGLPIIATKNIGSQEIIKDRKFGYLIAQEDCHALKHKLITLIKNKDLINKFGKRARKEAQEKYDWQKVIIPKYLEVYKSLITKIRDHEKYYYHHNPSYSQILENQDIDVFKKYVDFIRKYSFPKANFLEVGCGVGQVLGLLKNDNIKSYGVDVSKSSIKKCRDKKLNCRCYGGKRLPFGNDYFDLIASYNVLEHTNNPENFLAEQLRVLKKGGYLIIVCPNFLAVTNNYHYHTKGIIQKMRNLAAIIRRSVSRRYIFAKMKTVKKDNFCPDDDACNVTDPQDLLRWAKRYKLKLIHWSSQPVYKKGLIKFLDYSFFRIFFGSLFMIFKKR